MDIQKSMKMMILMNIFSTKKITISMTTKKLKKKKKKKNMIKL